MIVAMDFRPALLSQSGIARVVRELTARLATGAAVKELRLFGHSLAKAKVPLQALPPGTRLFRQPLPGRSIPALAKIGIGADTLCMGCDLFLWTDYVFPPVKRANKAMILHDLAFLKNPEWHGETSKILAQRTLKACIESDFIIVPSPSVAEDTKSLLPEIYHKVHIVPWAGDHAPALLERARRPNDELQIEAPLFVTIGTVEPRKDYATLIESFLKVKENLPKAELVIFGRAGWADDKLLNTLKKLDRDGRSGVTWHQSATDRRVMGTLSQATALVYPSLYEGFGLPVAEAGALEIPSITAMDTASSWVSGNGGLTFHGGKGNELAEKMLLLGTDHALRQELAEQAKERSSTFSWEKTAKAFDRIIMDYAR